MPRKGAFPPATNPGGRGGGGGGGRRGDAFPLHPRPPHRNLRPPGGTCGHSSPPSRCRAWGPPTRPPAPRGATPRLQRRTPRCPVPSRPVRPPTFAPSNTRAGAERYPSLRAHRRRRRRPRPWGSGTPGPGPGPGPGPAAVLWPHLMAPCCTAGGLARGHRRLKLGASPVLQQGVAARPSPALRGTDPEGRLALASALGPHGAGPSRRWAGGEAEASSRARAGGAASWPRGLRVRGEHQRAPAATDRGLHCRERVLRASPCPRRAGGVAPRRLCCSAGAALDGHQVLPWRSICPRSPEVTW